MMSKKVFSEALWPKVGLNYSAGHGLGMSVTVHLNEHVIIIYTFI